MRTSSRPSSAAIPSFSQEDGCADQVRIKSAHDAREQRFHSSGLRGGGRIMQVLSTDVVIVGGGAAGCYAALNLHRHGIKTVCCRRDHYNARAPIERRAFGVSYSL